MYDSDCGPNENNYADYFHMLLYLDQFVAVQSMENYNMTNVPVEIVSDMRFQLQVGLVQVACQFGQHFIKPFVLWNC
jgi:hypothetical protein